MTVFNELADTLARLPSPIRVFFRNDDGGWADQRLQLLCDRFREQELPLDIAVIPAALSDASVQLITTAVSAFGADVHIHQHGFAHANHQLEGRACEFGSDRSYQEQLSDIVQGRQILQDKFGDIPEPLFTPPWNRCTADTALALNELGFKRISRITGSTSIGDIIPALDVSIDWLKKRKGERLNVAQLCNYACQSAKSSDGSLGVMLHHQQMDDANLDLLAEFVAVLKRSDMVSFASMLNQAQEPMSNTRDSTN